RRRGVVPVRRPTYPHPGRGVWARVGGGLCRRAGATSRTHWLPNGAWNSARCVVRRVGHFTGTRQAVVPGGLGIRLTNESNIESSSAKPTGERKDRWTNRNFSNASQ